VRRAVTSGHAALMASPATVFCVDLKIEKEIVRKIKNTCFYL
jgi:hypothetical protein